VSESQSDHHVHRASETTEESGVVWVQHDLALRGLVPLADVLSGSLLEQSLVVRDAVFAVDEACHCEDA